MKTAIVLCACLLAGCSSFNFRSYGAALCGGPCQFVNGPAAAASAP